MAQTARNTNTHSRSRSRANALTLQAEIAPERAHAPKPAPTLVATAKTATTAEYRRARYEAGFLGLRCVACKHEWEISRDTRTENVRCPECRAWNRVRLHPDLERYVRGLALTASGNQTLDIADATADALRGQSIDETYSITAQHLETYGIETMSKGFRKEYGDRPWTADTIASYLQGRYAARNTGMQRMNLGNLLRAASQRSSQIALANAGI